MYLLYDLILLVSTLVLVPLYLVRGVRQGKVRLGIRERLGFYSPERLAPLEGKTVFWIHAVSVGETRAAVPLVKALKAAHPDCALVLSNVTETGHAIAGGISEVDVRLFFPFDLSWVVRRVLRKVRPSLAVIVETEIWPNFVREAHRAGVPLVLVNGRISDRSFPRYRALRILMRPLLQKFSALCMQSELDAERIVQMGAPTKNVTVTRNLKFDMQAPIPGESEVDRLRNAFGVPEQIPVWVAGSTHAGEEEAVAAAYQKLLGEGRELFLVLVPRHPERCRAVGEMLADKGIAFALRSEIDSRQSALTAGEVLLVDTLGEMLKLYAVSDLVFVGGSLVEIGGHNVLEASLLKKPVLYGPYMHNFKEISRLLLEAGGGMLIEDPEELSRAVGGLLDDGEGRRRMGEGGYALLQRNLGATAHTLDVLEEALGR